MRVIEKINTVRIPRRFVSIYCTCVAFYAVVNLMIGNYTDWLMGGIYYFGAWVMVILGSADTEDGYLSQPLIRIWFITMLSGCIICAVMKILLTLPISMAEILNEIVVQ